MASNIKEAVGHHHATMVLPLPKGHWSTTETYNSHPPAPFLTYSDDELRAVLAKGIEHSARWAIAQAGPAPCRSYDPDALVQMMIIAMLGYNQPNPNNKPAEVGKDEEESE